MVVLLASQALLFALPAEASTYQVGPGRSFATLQEIAPRLAPGDVVEVDGGVTYPGDLKLEKSGTKGAKITLRGVMRGGRRPVIAGGVNTVHVHADHYVIEGFEVTGGAARCVFHHGDDLTLRNTIVHDCPAHGILGADEESGSLTLSYVEVYAAGAGDTKHPIYIATDEEAHPGSVFRMEHCYVHDGRGGNNVKSRAERNEIYYNWIEGAAYHELELIGPDGADEGLAREDSDVVGNVLRKTTATYVTRLGGDGTGQTFGRYRFVGNTFVLAQGSLAAFRLFDGIDSVEMHNNVFYREGGGGVELVRDADATWVNGPAIAGAGNWVTQGSTNVPSSLTDTLTGVNPGFRDLTALDVRPAAGSALIDHGAAVLRSPSGHPFPSPLDAPRFVPPLHQLEPTGSASARQAASDIGAYERLSLAGHVTTASAMEAPSSGDSNSDSDGSALPPSAGCAVAQPVGLSKPGGMLGLLGLLACAGSVRALRRAGAIGRTRFR